MLYQILFLLAASLFPTTALVCSTILALNEKPIAALCLALLAILTLPRWNK